MPKDYQNAIIFKIISKNSNEIYIGATVQRLSSKIATIRADYKRFLNGKKKFNPVFKLLESGDIDYERIDKTPCDNMEELNEILMKYKNKYDCIDKNDKIEGGLTPTQKKNKTYYEKNKNELKEQSKKYYKANKNEILKQKKKYYEKTKEQKKIKNKCICCYGKYTSQNWRIHQQSKKHQRSQLRFERLQDLIPLYHQYDHCDN